MNIKKTLSQAQKIAGITLAFILTQNASFGAEDPVELGSASKFAILAKSGISTVPASVITGDIGVSPIDSTSMTGFSLILDSTTQFSTSTQVVGKAYASDYSPPTPANMTTTISAMETAYMDAKGRTLPDATELGAGEIGGMTIAPGLYKWSSGVLITTDVTLSGGASDVWIFQIAGNLTMAGSKSVILSGGAQAANIFWQVEGGVGVDLGTGSHFEGIIMTIAGINMQTGASINGRLFAQTAVTLDANVVTEVTASSIGITLQSTSSLNDSFNDAAGQFINIETRTITVPLDGSIQFYRILADTALNITNIIVADGNAVLNYE